MNRRSFLTSLIGGVAASAAVRTWPFRVYSFPKEIEYASGTIGAITRSSYPGRLCTPPKWCTVSQEELEDTMREFNNNLTRDLYLYGRAAYYVPNPDLEIRARIVG